MFNAMSDKIVQDTLPVCAATLLATKIVLIAKGVTQAQFALPGAARYQ